MQLIFLTNTVIDWAAIGQGSLASLVITAVFVVIVKPLINHITSSNTTLSTAVTELNKTISNGDLGIAKGMKETEEKIIERIISKIEAAAISKESIEQLKAALQRIESKIDDS